MPTLPRIILAVVAISFALGVSASKLQQAVYWGQTPGQANLSHFCDDSQGIDIIPLAFLSQFGAPFSPGGGFGDCNITVSQSGPVTPACAQVASDIEYCQSQGKLVLLSLGGAVGNYGLSNQSDAEALASDLWAMYGPLQEEYAGPRPLGDVVLDGFDLDIENSVGSYIYIFFIWKLRELFETTPTRKFVISGAPQCVVPDASMGDMIFNSPFNYLFIQYYNTGSCSAKGKISGYGDGEDQYFTFDAWRQFTRIRYSQSIESKLLIGLSATAGSADNDQPYYLGPTEVLELIDEYRDHEGFSGVMLWDAGSSDANVVDGCTYSQQISSILLKGRMC